MKIDKQTFQKFLQYVGMRGICGVRSCILEFNEEGLHIASAVAANNVLVEGTLKKSAFIEYEAIGCIGIGDLQRFLTFIDRSQDVITILLEENKIVLKSKSKRISYVTQNVKYIQMDFKSLDDIEIPFNEQNKINLDIELIKYFASKDISLLGNNEIVIEFQPGRMILKGSNDDSIFEEFSVETQLIEQAKFGNDFIDAITNLDGEVEFIFQTDFPLKITKNDENINVQIIVSPKIIEE